MRFRNIFSGELVTKTGETADGYHTIIHYKRDNALSGEFGHKMIEFTKPKYVFMQCYKEVSADAVKKNELIYLETPEVVGWL